MSLKKITRDLLIVGLMTSLVFGIIDFFAGHALLAVARKEGKKDTFRAPHHRYHHTLMPDYEGTAYWGPFSYWVCTNDSGMKSDCQNKLSGEKHFDVAFIGDSFTEGVGVPYEDSFVGMVAKANPDLKIANLGVVSYSPTIYLKKLEDYLDRGYTFKKVIVFVDIGDIMDESFYIEDEKGNALLTSEVVHPGMVPFFKRRLQKNFPLAYEGLHHIKQTALRLNNLGAKSNNSVHVAELPREVSGEQATDPHKSTVEDKNSVQFAKDRTPVTHPTDSGAVSKGSELAHASVTAPVVSKRASKEPWIYEQDYARSAWTYNLDAPGYGELGVRKSIDKTVKQMERVATLLRSRGIALSVGVYPWPAQLLFDQAESSQVAVWRNFCEQRCENFYNAFPLFFKALHGMGLDATIARYYFAGDMHYNREGNALVAEAILSVPLVQNSHMQKDSQK